MEGKLTVDSLLLVRPCVQELAKGKPVVVPPRYLQPDQDPPHVKLSRSSTDQDVPAIDMQLLLSGDNSVADSELQKLDLACKDWGFFQLINHGVSTSLVEKVKAETREFFDMPMEEKKKFWQEAGEVQGYGQAFVFSEDQKLDWADMFYMITLPRNIRLPHLFPQLPLPFRDTLDTYSQELYGLGMKIVMQMAKALTMEAEEMRLLFEGGMQAIRMNYYPPCPQPEHVIGLTPHSDPQGLTILLQLNETDGLQIKKDDRWLPIKPLPNAFIINVGNVLELINHGVSTSLVEKVKAETREFFDMPMEEKKKFWQEAGEVQGYGQAFVFSEDQKLDWADMLYMVTLTRNIRLPHLFPRLPLPFRDTLDTYSQELDGLGMKILMQMAKALNMDVEEMRLMFEGGMRAVRMNYYPPCPQPENVIGLTPHFDPHGLTIVLLLNEMDGLQIKKDGRWILIKPLPNAFVINIGNILEMVTDGTYPSIEHRANINSKKERLSIATFLSPKLDDNVGPAPSLISPETPPLFKTIGFADYFRGFLSRELNGKSYLDAMRVQEDDTNI